jgi:hypothetical protein
MQKMAKTSEHTTQSTALQHAALSVILLGIIMLSLFQITHLLIESHDSASLAALTTQP